MRKSICEMDWEELLPEPLKSDPAIFAMAKAISEQKRDVAQSIWNTRVWLEIDRMPEEVLDILAYDLNIRWYSGDFSLEQKRNVLMSAFQVYKTLGTAGAVKRALKDIYEAAEVYEWFQYGGDPYKFRVQIDTTQLGGNLAHSDIRTAIDTFKPVRAWLERIAYMTRARIGLSVTTAIFRLDYEMCGTQPGISTGMTIERGGVTASAASIAYRTELALCGEEGI